MPWNMLIMHRFQVNNRIQPQFSARLLQSKPMFYGGQSGPPAGPPAVACPEERCENEKMIEGDGKGTWWVYMIACRGERIYTGTAMDPEARYEAHRAGKGAAFTRANRPVALLRSIPFGTRSEACRAEAALKKMSREKKLSWAKGFEDVEGSTRQ